MSEPLSSPVGNSEREYYADEMNKGWKARAEKAEAEAKALREALKSAVYCIDHHYEAFSPCDCDQAAKAHAALGKEGV